MSNLPAKQEFGRAIHAADLLHSEEAAEAVIAQAEHDWNKLVTFGQSLLQAEQWCHWTLGKLLAAVETKWSEASIREFAQDIGISEARAYSIRRTYLAFQEPESRRPELTFGHHEVAACRPEPEKAIELAAEKNLTIRELRTATVEGTTRKPKPLWETVCEALKDKRAMQVFVRGFFACLRARGYKEEEIQKWVSG